MALNLWKLGGQPTSYNPLPIGTNVYNNKIKIGLGDFVVSFRGKSMSGKTDVTVTDTDRDDIKQIIRLGSSFQKYEFSFTSKTYSQDFLFADEGLKGDIIIEDIQLVQKPLPKLTINGIDGFNSGKWNLHANARVVDDETVELNATTQWQSNKITLPCLPNQKYRFSVSSDNVNAYPAIYYNTDVNATTKLYDGNSINILDTNVEITTPTGATTLIIHLTCKATGTFTFKCPMLNLGTTPAPYEPKRGERMVLPSVKGKNLLNPNRWTKSGNTIVEETNSFWKVSTDSNATGMQFIVSGLKPNSDYSIHAYAEITKRVDDNVNVRVYNRTTSSYVHSGVGAYLTTTNEKKKIGGTFNTGNISPNDVIEVWFVQSHVVPADLMEFILYKEGLMLNEGTPLPYEPYAVQLNKKPKRWVPKKNLIPTDVSGWKQGNAYGVPVVDRITLNKPISFKQNQKYTASCNDGYMIVLVEKLSNESVVYDTAWQSSGYVYTTGSNPSGTLEMTIKKVDGGNIIPSEIINVKPMLEEGTTATPYEPYQLVLPRAKSGLAFEGVRSYVDLPSSLVIDNKSFELETTLSTTVKVESVIFALNDTLYLCVAGVTGVLSFRNGTHNYGDKGIADGLKHKIKVIYDVTTSIMNIYVNDIFYKQFTLPPLTNSTFKRIGARGANLFFNGTIYDFNLTVDGISYRYDFTNPSNIVGDKVIPNAQNLIPSFDDSRWNLHSNFKVLGRDVGRLELVSNGSWRHSLIVLPVTIGKTYLLDIAVNTGFIRLYRGQESLGENLVLSNKGTFTVDSSYGGFVTFSVNNGLVTTGTFDFIKPQLYELTGKEGTLVGNPTPLRKASKRNLTRKR